MLKNGDIISNEPAVNNPQTSKLDEIISRGKSLQSKLSNINVDSLKNPLYAFQNKRDELKREELLFKNTNFDTFSIENRLIEYPIEKIGDIVTAKKMLSPELELQKLKLDEAGYMDYAENNKKFNNNHTIYIKDEEKIFKKNEIEGIFH